MKHLTRQQILSRMRHGDLPTNGGGYTSRLMFDDRARSTSAMGHALVKEGIINPPEHTSVHSTYTLAKQENKS